MGTDHDETIKALAKAIRLMEVANKLMGGANVLLVLGFFPVITFAIAPDTAHWSLPLFLSLFTVSLATVIVSYVFAMLSFRASPRE